MCWTLGTVTKQNDLAFPGLTDGHMTRQFQPQGDKGFAGSTEAPSKTSGTISWNERCLVFQVFGGASKKKPSEVEGREVPTARRPVEGTGVLVQSGDHSRAGGRRRKEARPKAHISCIARRGQRVSGVVCLWGSPPPRGVSDHVHSHLSTGKTEVIWWRAWLGQGHRASGAACGSEQTK